MESISTYIFLIKITKIFAIYSSYWSNIFLDILCIFVLFIFLCFKLLALVVFQKLLVIFPHFNLAWIGSIVSFFFFLLLFFLFISFKTVNEGLKIDWKFILENIQMKILWKRYYCLTVDKESIQSFLFDRFHISQKNTRIFYISWERISYQILEAIQFHSILSNSSSQL